MKLNNGSRGPSGSTGFSGSADSAPIDNAAAPADQSLLDSIRDAKTRWQESMEQDAAARAAKAAKAATRAAKSTEEGTTTAGAPSSVASGGGREPNPLAGEASPELLYTPLDGDTSRYMDDLGFPGQYPFTRGVQANMYRGKLWTMRQYAGFGSAADTNRRFHYLLEQGQTGLSVAFDLPTQMGLDSDNPLAEGEVGRVGVAIDTVDDLAILFDQIPLDKVSISMTINSTATTLLAMLQVMAEETGAEVRNLRGTVQNDVLKEYVARGTYIYPPRPSVRLVTDLMAYCNTNMPKWNTISISGYHIREAGADAIQEVAFCLGNGITYVQAALNAGLSLDSFAGRLSFFFNVHNNFLEEIAKFRAARRLWARLMRDRFGATDPNHCMLRFHTQTAGSTLTAQQPDNNVIRVALQALAAVLGGTQSLHTNSRDEALALPSEQSVRIALRTQQIIAHESGVTDIVDPLGGSYAIEALTDRIERGAVDYLDRIDAMGGMVAAIERGFVSQEIEDSAYAWQRSVESGERVVVGVNRFQTEETPPANLFSFSPELERAQVDRLHGVKAKRDSDKVAASLAMLEEKARTNENLMPFIVEAVRRRVTIGEISATLRTVFGHHNH